MAIKKDRPTIDQHCDVSGKTELPKEQAQNRAKNNFCASGLPALTTFFTFRHLQTDAVAAVGAGLPENRSLLQDLHETTEGALVGEGAVVQVVAFLIQGKFSNVGDGESVNCNLPDAEENDIHINLVEAKPPATLSKTQLRALECKSIVVEISPHFRPEAWEILESLHQTTINATAAKKIDALDLRRPLRFTGQAFYDASHKPCDADGTPHGSSHRISSWEIHPIYAIDVCVNTSKTGCPFDKPDAGSRFTNGLPRRTTTTNPEAAPTTWIQIPFNNSYWKVRVRAWTTRLNNIASSEPWTMRRASCSKPDSMPVNALCP